MDESSNNAETPPVGRSDALTAEPSGRGLEESTRAVAAHVVTGRAAADLVRAAYERAFYIVKPEERKRWGTLAAQLQAGWDDAASVVAARIAVDALVADLVAIGRRMKQIIGAPVIVVASCLTLLAIVQHTLHRRCDEVQAAVAQREAVEVKSAAGGGGAETVETQVS